MNCTEAGTFLHFYVIVLVHPLRLFYYILVTLTCNPWRLFYTYVTVVSLLLCQYFVVLHLPSYISLLALAWACKFSPSLYNGDMLNLLNSSMILYMTCNTCWLCSQLGMATGRGQIMGSLPPPHPNHAPCPTCPIPTPWDPNLPCFVPYLKYIIIQRLIFNNTNKILQSSNT